MSPLADVAQPVERRLPKPKVAGSRPVVRFDRERSHGIPGEQGSRSGGEADRGRDLLQRYPQYREPQGPPEETAFEIVKGETA